MSSCLETCASVVFLKHSLHFTYTWNTKAIHYNAAGHYKTTCLIKLRCSKLFSQLLQMLRKSLFTYFDDLSRLHIPTQQTDLSGISIIGEKAIRVKNAQQQRAIEYWYHNVIFQRKLVARWSRTHHTSIGFQSWDSQGQKTRHKLYFLVFPFFFSPLFVIIIITRI